MKNLKFVVLPLFAAVLSAGCASDSASGFKGIPYTGGDVCEWAKQNLVATQQAFNEGSYFTRPARESAALRIEQAQRTVVASCGKSKDDDGAWACAEGHSCK